MYCKQTGLKFSIIDTKTDAKVTHVFDKPQKYKKGISEHTSIGLKILELSNETKLYYLNQLPEEILNIEKPEIFMIEIDCPDVLNPMVSPHVDYKRTCSLNLYTQTNGEKTSFYQWNKEKQACIEVEFFFANDNECWLLNTSAVHSVALVPNTQRMGISFSFNKISYEKMRHLL
jgi:hypothetical protein